MRIFNVGLMIEDQDNGFTKAMRKIATGGYAQIKCYHGSFNSDLLREVSSFKPDLIFMQFQAPDIITKQTASQLAKMSFVMNFSGDVREQLPCWYTEIGQVIQLSTFSNMIDVRKCNAVGVKADYLEIGFDPERYNKRNIPKQKPSIVAHFNHYPDMFPLTDYRVAIVQRLKKEFGDEFGVYGNFPDANGNFNSDQIAESHNYNRAKIAINCSHFNYERYASDRMLRILGSGTMCLSHNYTGIEKDYKVGEEVDVFNNIDELVDKCRYYLNEENKREEIATKGFELAHKNFTFEKMCLNVVELYKKHK